MKVIELKINDSTLAGFEATALVENPAIEMDFVAFNKVIMAEETYNDYPESMVEAAKRGIELNKENNQKCATQVGKVRAQQLANRENLSLDTVKRMRSFLLRQKDNYELATKRKDYNACGYISYLLWGGEAGIGWAEKKLRQAGEEFAEFSQVINNEGMLETLASLDDACETGYKAIGLKTKNGRKVPNCVPESKFEEELFNQVLIDMMFAEGVPHYTKDGELYEGPIHSSDGRIMKSEFLYHYDELEEFEINIAALPNYVNEASIGKKNKFAAQLAEKQMIVGPLMTPGKLIPRVDEKTGEDYNVFFSAETIEQIAYKAMKDKLIDNVNIEHDSESKIDDVYLAETWLVKDPEHDKSTLYGFKPVVGEWFGIYKVNNPRVWNTFIKTGKVKGFSVEGYFINNILTNK